MSTFWHKMSGLGLVISNLYGDIVRKIIFLCPLRYIFEARVHFRDWKVSFKAMLSGKTQWRLMSTFSHKMSGLGLVISNLYGDIVRKIIFLCPLRYIFEARVHFKDWKVSFKAMLSGKTQWRLMSTFSHKMSGLGLVISNLYGDIVRKIIFLCPLRYIFEARVHFKDWKVSFKVMLSGKTQWRLMSTFWHKMSDLKPVCSFKMWKLTQKSYFCALSVTFLRLGCILNLEGLLQGYVKRKNTMTFNVNFLTQNVGPWTCYKQFIWGYCPKNHIFVPSPLHFWCLGAF